MEFQMYILKCFECGWPIVIDREDRTRVTCPVCDTIYIKVEEGSNNVVKKGYLGYGSPQALEAALNDKDDHFEVTQENLLGSITCSDLPQEEVVARMASRLCGTKAGWQLVEGTEQGIPCEKRPGFKHYVFEC